MEPKIAGTMNRETLKVDAEFYEGRQILVKND